MNNLIGLHHVTSITSNIEKIYDLFTRILGLRLVKKTINQDDINTYHLFFADDVGSAGTDITFFDFKGIKKRVPGTNEIYKTGFRVPSDEALIYYQKRFIKYNIKHGEIEKVFNKKTLTFYDFDDQEYILFSDQNNIGIPAGTPWQKGPVPNEYAINGLGPSFIRVDDIHLMHQVLTNVLKMTKSKHENNYHLYEMAGLGNGASLIVSEVKNSNALQGYGGVHHLAFRVVDKVSLQKWINYFNALNIRTSGYVDRFYFESLYVRLYPNILFEIATDGPGFIDDEESYDELGTKLALPPKFRANKEYITKLIKHIDTSNDYYEKEYL